MILVQIETKIFGNWWNRYFGKMRRAGLFQRKTRGCESYKLENYAIIIFKVLFEHIPRKIVLILGLF